MNRWLALMLSVLAGAAAALAVLAGAVAVMGGVLWLYVFGDDPWPAWVEQLLNLAVPLAGLLLWALFARVIWSRVTAPPAAG